MFPERAPRPYRVAMVCSHAVQYFMPWFRQLSADPRLDLTVLLGHDHGLKDAAFDPGFGRRIQWDVPLTEGLHVEVLKNHAPRPGVSRFLGVVNLGWRKVLTRARFDAAVMHGWNYATYPLALLAARRNGVPVLLRAESPLRDEPPAPDTSALRGDARRVWHDVMADRGALPGDLRRLVRDAILAPYVGAVRRGPGGVQRQPPAAALLRHARRRASFFPLRGGRRALRPAPAERRAARAALRAELRLADEVPLFVSVGKLQPVKDPGLLLSAYAALRREGVPAALGFVGDGELRQRLMEDRPRRPRCPLPGLQEPVRAAGGLCRGGLARAALGAGDLRALVVTRPCTPACR